MLVPIRPAEGAGPPIWAMIELQGEIERLDGKEGSGFDVGTFSISSTGSLLLTIGYHQLEGKPQQLRKPLAVLSTAQDTDSGNEMEYEVTGVVREKYLFKARPKPLITKIEPKEKPPA